MWILVEVDSPHDVGRNEKRRIIINGSEVHPATTTEKEDDETEYQVEMKGSSPGKLTNIKVTLKSNYKTEIEKFVPFAVGEQRAIQFDLLNRTLDEYEGEAQ
jgi:hypothetical protein